MGAFYHGISKKIIVGFGSLFSDIHIIRRKDDTVTGEVSQDIRVPINYAPKSKWMEALISDPTRDKQVRTTLPRMSFELTGISYDSSRKMTRTSTISCSDADGNAISVSTPAPWNYEFMLYIVTNSQEDMFQILEQILPTFNPDYTLKIRTIPQLGIIQNVPVSLTSVAIQDDYDGDYNSQRLLIYTLPFVAKAVLYGEVKETKTITDVNITMSDGDLSDSSWEFTTDGDGNIQVKMVDINTNIGTTGSTALNNSDSQSPEVLVTEEGKIVGRY